MIVNFDTKRGSIYYGMKELVLVERYIVNENVATLQVLLIRRVFCISVTTIILEN